MTPKPAVRCQRNWLQPVFRITPRVGNMNMGRFARFHIEEEETVPANSQKNWHDANDLNAFCSFRGRIGLLRFPTKAFLTREDQNWRRRWAEGHFPLVL